MNLHKTLIITLLLTTFSFNVQALKDNFDIPELNIKKLKALSLWATYYHIWHTKTQDKGMPLLDKNNNKISANISLNDWCKGAIQGTILITSKTGKRHLFNYQDHQGKQQVDCAKVMNINPSWIGASGKTRYRLAQGAFGDGVKNYKLTPYRTIAVDKKKIPYGSVLYIPKARGVSITLPSGQKIKHDGYFFAGDTGGAIKKQHIDVFMGLSPKNIFAHFIKNTPKKPFKAYIVKQQNVINQLRDLHH